MLLENLGFYTFKWGHRFHQYFRVANPSPSPTFHGIGYSAVGVRVLNFAIYLKRVRFIGPTPLKRDGISKKRLLNVDSTIQHFRNLRIWSNSAHVASPWRRFFEQSTQKFLQTCLSPATPTSLLPITNCAWFHPVIYTHVYTFKSSFANIFYMGILRQAIKVVG